MTFSRRLRTLFATLLKMLLPFSWSVLYLTGITAQCVSQYLHHASQNQSSPITSKICGRGRIRTHGTLSRPTVFKTAAIDRSATLPDAGLSRLSPLPAIGVCLFAGRLSSENALQKEMKLGAHPHIADLTRTACAVRTPALSSRHPIFQPWQRARRARSTPGTTPCTPPRS